MKGENKAEFGFLSGLMVDMPVKLSKPPTYFMEQHMPAFKDTTLAVLSNAIVTLYERMQQTNVVDLTHEDIMTMWAPPGDIETLFKIRHITSEHFTHNRFEKQWHMPSAEHGVAISTMLIVQMYDTPNNKHPAMPKVRKLSESVDAALLDKINAWLLRRWQLGVDYSRVRQVLHVLNDICSSPQQVKFLWPSIMSLCKMNEATLGIATAMERARTPNTIPTLSPELRQACRKTAGAIAVANLLGDSDTPVTREVTLTCDGIRVTEEGLGTWTSF